MTSKRLFILCVLILLIDIISCHLGLIETLLPAGYAYYLYCVSQAATMWLLYYRVSLQLEDPEYCYLLTPDEYYKRCQFLFYIIMPFALKQIIDEALFRSGQLDWMDYPVLLITAVIAYRKYYVKT